MTVCAPGAAPTEVADGQRGAVTGEGCYVWEDGTPTTGAEPDPDVPTRDSEPDLR